VKGNDRDDKISASKTKDPMVRFMAKVVMQEDGHWRWTGHIDKAGYARFDAGRRGVDRRSHQAYRWIYERLVAPISDGWEVHHVCRYRWCVNPRHLEAMPRTENRTRPQVCPRCGYHWREGDHD
jgi:hypothetical protein